MSHPSFIKTVVLIIAVDAALCASVISNRHFVYPDFLPDTAYEPAGSMRDTDIPNYDVMRGGRRGRIVDYDSPSSSNMINRLQHLEEEAERIRVPSLSQRSSATASIRAKKAMRIRSCKLNSTSQLICFLGLSHGEISDQVHRLFIALFFFSSNSSDIFKQLLSLVPSLGLLLFPSSN